MSFDDLGNWEVSAREEGEPKLAGLFAQTNPRQAAAVMATTVRVKFHLEPERWRDWTLWCARCTMEVGPRSRLPGERRRAFSECSPTRARATRRSGPSSGGRRQPRCESRGLNERCRRTLPSIRPSNFRGCSQVPEEVGRPTGLEPVTPGATVRAGPPFNLKRPSRPLTTLGDSLVRCDHRTDSVHSVAA